MLKVIIIPKKSREPKRGMQSALIWGSHRHKHVGMSKQLLISKKTGHVGAIFKTEMMINVSEKLIAINKSCMMTSGKTYLKDFTFLLTKLLRKGDVLI